MHDSPHAEPNPALILETLTAYQASAALRGAIELDLFTGVSQGNTSVAAIAEFCQANTRGTRILCDFLVVHGFLTKDGDSYGLTPTSEIFLVSESPKYMGSVARFVNSDDVMGAFRDVAQLVRGGATLLEGAGTTENDYEGWIEFAQSMVPLMMPAATCIAEFVSQRMTGPISVLDIAAGHGMFGISIAQRNTQATVTALDWENVLNVARENARRHGVEDRYHLLPGNAMQVEYGSGYDLVLLTNIFHHFDQEACRSMMRKVHDCLKPDGYALTLEFIPNEDRVSPPVPATFSFTMLGTTPAGDAYTFLEYESMWQDSGLHDNQLLDVPDSNQRLIVSAR